MELSDYVDIVRDQLTGFGVLQSELDDDAYRRLINVALKEVQRYYNEVDLKTLSISGSCLDLSDYPEIGTIMNVYRITQGESEGESTRDPVYMSQLQMYNFGRGGFSNDYIYRIGAYNAMSQIANTLSTDLQFKQDKRDKKLYINFSQGTPSSITIEYIPNLRDVSDIVEDFWEDILIRLSVAHAKIALGRIRSRFTQSQALWSSDGAGILSEGTTELKDLRDRLRDNVDMVLPLD